MARAGLFLWAAIVWGRFNRRLARGISGKSWLAGKLGSTTAQLQPVTALEFLPKVNTGQSTKASSLLHCCFCPPCQGLTIHFTRNLSPGRFDCATLPTALNGASSTIFTPSAFLAFV
jgi:hypothetical protein